MTKKGKLVTALATILVVMIGLVALAATAKKMPNNANSLNACASLPNNSIQNIIETNRLTIKIPKNIYLQQEDLPLIFQSISGSAQAKWISSQGVLGKSIGATSKCSAYYYEFDGSGEVDLSLKSAENSQANYFVRFIVSSSVINSPKIYRNDLYRFTFNLPDSWIGYSVLSQRWTGYTTGGTKGQVISERGPLITLRNPNWTLKQAWQDIPIMVFTRSQWSALQAEKFYVSAAPIPPSELGANSKYIFALPPRYNYAFPMGWQEVETILKVNPLIGY